MNRLALVLFCFGAPFAFAYQGTKVGMIDADRVVQESQKGKAFLAKLDAMSSDKKNEIQAKTTVLQGLENDLQTKAASLSQANLQKIRDDITSLRKELDRMTSDAERVMDRELTEGLDEIRKEMMPIIREVAIEKNLDLVLNLGPKSPVVYFHDRINITNDVIKKYDELQN